MLPRSAVSHLVWPAMPGNTAALLLALQYQFDKAERLPPPELERLQFSALAPLARHARTTVPYYRDDPAYASLDQRSPLTRTTLQTVPILERSQVQAAGITFKSEKVPDDHTPVAEYVTSGSTGHPLRSSATRISAVLWHAITLRDLLWHQRDVSAKLVAIRAEGSDDIPAEGRALDNWGPAAAAVFGKGPCLLYSIQHDIDTQAGWLRKDDPAYLLSYPSNLYALAQHFLQLGERLPSLRQVCTYGEGVTADLREMVRRAWGVGITDMYTAQELGYIALQCPSAEQYHVQAESAIVEILDDADRPCRPGQVGRVVVTALHNYAMPLFRYANGDYAEVGSPCPCGRTLPVLSRIVGRQRNMLTLSGGRKVWPTFPAKDWAHLDAIRQLQLVQHDLDHIEARVVGPRPLHAQEEAEFADLLRRRFTHPFEVSFSYLAAIDRSQRRKFEDFVSHVD